MIKKYLILLILLFNSFHSIAQSENINFINDLPGHSIKKILFFIGDLSIIDTQINLINKLINVDFLVLVSSDLSKSKDYIEKKYNYNNVHLKFLDYPITSWTQDRLLRSEKQISGVFSTHTLDGYSIYETVAAHEAQILYQFTNKKFTNNYYVSKFTGKDPFLTSTKNTKFLNIDKNSLFYGDGGDRLITEKFIFLGGNTFNQTSSLNSNNIENIENITMKKIIEIDKGIFDRYAFHLDLFLTFINDETVVFGSYQEALTIVPNNLSWIDYDFMNKKKSNEIEIIEQLEKLKFHVVKIPLIYKKDSGFISFNNGIYNENNFYISNFDFKDKEINNTLKSIKEKSINIFKKENISLNFIDGGENNINYGGQVRCTAAIIEY